MKNFKQLTPEQEKAISTEIKHMLHAHRDCLRNRKRDTKKITFDCGDGYYGEAFGILRALRTLGYGDFGAINDGKDGNANLKWWFQNLQEQVLQEEHFDSTGECDFCVKRYGKDDAGRTREDL